MVVEENMELVVLVQIILVQLNKVFQEEMDLPLGQHMVVVEAVALVLLVVLDQVLLVVLEVTCMPCVSAFVAKNELFWQA